MDEGIHGTKGRWPISTMSMGMAGKERNEEERKKQMRSNRGKWLNNTYLQWNTTQKWEKESHAVCFYTNGPREYHVEWH